MPIPRLIYIPSLNSPAIRLAIPNLSNAINDSLSLFCISQPHRPPLYPPLVIMALKDPVNVDTGHMYLVGIQLAGLHQVLDLCNGNRPRLSHRGRKIARSLSEQKIPHRVAFPGLNDGKISME